MKNKKPNLLGEYPEIVSKGVGDGLSECTICRMLGKYSLTWTCFLYQIEGSDALYCAEHAREVLES